MSDIANIKPTDRTIEILHPGTEEPIGIRHRLVSINDDRLKAVKRHIRDAKLKLDARGKSIKSEEIEENGRRLLFGASIGWEWYNPTGREGDEGYDPSKMPEFHGEVPEFNQKNVMAVIKELDWYAAQLNDAIDDEKAFFMHSNAN